MGANSEAVHVAWIERVNALGKCEATGDANGVDRVFNSPVRFVIYQYIKEWIDSSTIGRGTGSSELPSSGSPPGAGVVRGSRFNRQAGIGTHRHPTAPMGRVWRVWCTQRARHAGRAAAIGLRSAARPTDGA